MKAIQDTVNLSRFFSTFLVRRMLSAGVFRYRGIKILMAFLTVVLLITLSAVSYLFYDSSRSAEGVAWLIISLANLTLPIWVSIGFIAVRLLFLKSSSMILLAENLPITEHQCSIAIFLNELKFVSLILIAVFFSSIAPIPFVYGVGTLPLLFTAIVFPAVTLIGVLSAVYNLLSWLFTVLGLGRIREMLSLALLLVFAGVSQLGVTNRVASITEAFQSGKQIFFWSNGYSWLAFNHSIWLSVALSIIICSILFIIAIATGGSLFVQQKEYVLMTRAGVSRRKQSNSQPAPWSWRLFEAHLLTLVRSQETWITVIISLGGYVVVLLSGLVSPVLLAELVAFLGVYSYSTTRPLREFSLFTPSPVRYYSYLCLSLVVVVAPLSLFFALGNMVLGGGISTSLFSALACVATIPVTVTMGVVIPTERDNPLAVIVSTAVTITCFILLILGLSVLSLSRWGWVISLIGFLLGVVFVGIKAIYRDLNLNL